MSALTIGIISQLRMSFVQLPRAERTLRDLVSSPAHLLAKRPALFLNPHVHKIALDSRLQSELGAIVMPGLASTVSACATLGLMQMTLVVSSLCDEILGIVFRQTELTVLSSITSVVEPALPAVAVQARSDRL